MNKTIFIALMFVSVFVMADMPALDVYLISDNKTLPQNAYDFIVSKSSNIIDSKDPTLILYSSSGTFFCQVRLLKAKQSLRDNIYDTVRNLADNVHIMDGSYVAKHTCYHDETGVYKCTLRGYRKEQGSWVVFKVN